MGFRKSCFVVAVAAVSGLMGCASSAMKPAARAQIAPTPAVATAPQTRPIYAMPLLTNPPAPRTGPIASSRDLRVMTFNLRVATMFDLWNTWGIRRGQVVDHVRKFDPDILGTQEGLAGMEDYLVKELSDYTFFGVGRNNGKRGGEMVGVFYKTSKFTKLDGGHFWLSEKPEKAGSKAWGAWFPRMVTWVKLQPTDGSQAFYWFNTHFDAFASKARTESAKLLLTRMNTIAGNAPTVITGDFNADAGSTPYELLTMNASNLFADAFRVANPTRSREEGTRHDFNGHKDGPRIDWILSNGAFATVSAAIDRGRALLGYPSDHFPMTATLRPVSAAPIHQVAQIQ